MALRAVTVEVAFTTTPFADPATLTWTDVSAYVESWSTSRGRQDEQSQMQAGTAQVSLQNADGRFDPDNGSSPYSPNILPGVPIRISTTFSATKYYLFWGFVESWEQHYDNMVPTVNITASDGMKAVLGYAIGLGYTETLVQDYGGTIGSEFDKVWPFQGVNNVNSYLNAATALVANSGISHPAGIAETGLQLSGSSSYFYWLDGDIGDLTYWLGMDGWFRIDTAPTSGIKCLFMNGNSNNSNVTPNLGFGPMKATFGDSMSAYVVTYPQNILAAATADPTSATGWSVSGTGASIAPAAITTATGLQRIYLDDGTTDFYGATKAMRLTMTSATGTIDLLSPFTNATAATAYTFQAVLSIEEARSTQVQVVIDWYNGASRIQTDTIGTIGGPSVVQATQIAAKVTAPTGTTKFQWHLTTTAESGVTHHVDLAQLIVVAGSFDDLIWYAGGATPAAQMLFNIYAYGNTNPPGQSVSANGWPCYASVNVPTAGSWFHIAIDSGTDNAATPYSSTTASRGLPSLWVNGVSRRLWTTGAPGTGITFNVASWASLGARVFFAGSGTPTVNTATSLAMTCDEIYAADGSTTTAAEVTAAKALAHYTYGLHRHDFISELTGARISDVLDSLGWPATQRAIDTGTVMLLAQAPDTSGGSLTGTQLIQDAGTAEGGLYFIARDGKFNFWDQSHTMGGSPVLILGDGATDVHYLGWPVISKDDTHIFNLIQLTQNVTDGSGTTSVVVQTSDATSQARYNLRTLQISAPWASSTDMATIAAATLADYKNPSSRVASIAVEGVTSNAFASLLPRDIGDFVEAHLVPLNYTGPAITISAFVQGIQISGGQDRTWMFTFSLSPTIAGH